MANRRVLKWSADKGFNYQDEEIPKDNNPKEHLLFVYGTLRYFNKHLLKGAQIFKKSIPAPNCLMYIVKDLPVLTEHKYAGNHTLGDIYKVTTEQLEAIDKFKLKRGIYERRQIRVGWDFEYTCWAYVFPKKDYSFYDPDWKYKGYREYGEYLKTLINEEELLNA